MAANGVKLKFSVRDRKSLPATYRDRGLRSILNLDSRRARWRVRGLVGQTQFTGVCEGLEPAQALW